MFFLCGRTIASIDKNTKCINYRTNLLVLFYEERNFTTYLEKIEKISRRHFVVDINIDFCIFTHRLELSLFIPFTRRFFFSLSLSLIFSLFLCGSDDARELLFFCGYLPKRKYDVMESFIYVGVQMHVYSDLH